MSSIRSLDSIVSRSVSKSTIFSGSLRAMRSTPSTALLYSSSKSLLKKTSTPLLAASFFMPPISSENSSAFYCSYCCLANLVSTSMTALNLPTTFSVETSPEASFLTDPVSEAKSPALAPLVCPRLRGYEWNGVHVMFPLMSSGMISFTVSKA